MHYTLVSALDAANVNVKYRYLTINTHDCINANEIIPKMSF